MKNCLSNPTFIFDFDGTIVDVFLKYYTILCDYLKKINIDIKNVMGIEEYKKRKLLLKKDHLIVDTLVSKEAFDIESYIKFKRKMLENTKYLELDTIVGGSEEILMFLKNKGYTLEILSKRESKIKLVRQIKKLRLQVYFSEINTVKNTENKYNVLAGKKNCIMVGDSPDDIKCAQLAGLYSYFVTSGLFSANDLSDKTNCKIIGSIKELQNIYQEKISLC